MVILLHRKYWYKISFGICTGYLTTGKRECMTERITKLNLNEERTECLTSLMMERRSQGVGAAPLEGLDHGGAVEGALVEGGGALGDGGGLGAHEGSVLEAGLGGVELVEVDRRGRAAEQPQDEALLVGQGLVGRGLELAHEPHAAAQLVGVGGEGDEQVGVVDGEAAVGGALAVGGGGLRGQDHAGGCQGAHASERGRGSGGGGGDAHAHADGRQGGGGECAGGIEEQDGVGEMEQAEGDGDGEEGVAVHLEEEPDS